MNPICIIYEASSKTGFGHLNRCRKLFDFLRKSNPKVRMIDLASITGEDKFTDEIIIIDISFNTKFNLSETLGSAKLLIGLDWFQEQKVDINIVAYAHKRPAANIKVFEGFDYLIIDQNISKLEPVTDVHLGRKVLVMVGGGDIKNVGVFIADQLYERGFDVKLIRGPFSSKLKEQKPYKVCKNEKNIPKVISEADWMVTNGGGCLFEALASGRPALSFAQTKFENNIIMHFLQNKAILGNSLKDLQKTKNLREIVSKGRSLIDGQGLERIEHIIQEAY